MQVFLQTSLEVKSPAAGVIKELLVEDGSTVLQGTQLFTIAVGAGTEIYPSVIGTGRYVHLEATNAKPLPIPD